MGDEEGLNIAEQWSVDKLFKLTKAYLEGARRPDYPGYLIFLVDAMEADKRGAQPSAPNPARYSAPSRGPRRARSRS